MNKPDIIATIGDRIKLRRAGSEYAGCCPFHDDHHPSFSVNANKGLFYCFGCGASGDVFDFVMTLDGLSFPEAKRALGVETEDCPPARRLTLKRKRAAERAAAWANEQRERLNILIAERYEQRDLADEVGAFDLAEAFDREIVVLRGFYDSLEYPRGTAEMLAVKVSIQQIADEVHAIDRPPALFPTVTPDYRAMLKDNPLNFERCF